VNLLFESPSVLVMSPFAAFRIRVDDLPLAVDATL
jgi:hypothetical protein